MNPFDQHKMARQALLDRIRVELIADHRFVAAWLMGSLGSQAGDSLSDIDLCVAISSPQAESFCRRLWMVGDRTIPERLAFFRQFGEPAILHENHQNAPIGGTFTNVTYREAAITVDWTFVDEATAGCPPGHVMLFNKRAVDFPIQTLSTGSREERAEAVSERVAFFWMMALVAIKYLLRDDTVYFLILLDTLHRVYSEVTGLLDGQPYSHQSGSRARLALSRPEQVQAVGHLLRQMHALEPAVVHLGGRIQDHAWEVAQRLLTLATNDETRGDSSPL